MTEYTELALLYKSCLSQFVLPTIDACLFLFQSSSRITRKTKSKINILIKFFFLIKTWECRIKKGNYVNYVNLYVITSLIIIHVLKKLFWIFLIVITSKEYIFHLVNFSGISTHSYSDRIYFTINEIILSEKYWKSYG